MSHVIPLLSASRMKIAISDADVSIFWPESRTNIIHTLSARKTSNFPTVIQPCALHTSVTCKWRRRGHAETSIKGSWLSKVPLCVARSHVSVALLSELPVELPPHPVHSELLLFYFSLTVHVCTCLYVTFMFCVDLCMDSFRQAEKNFTLIVPEVNSFWGFF